MTAPEVVIVGAGIGGLVTAWELARAGVSVLVCETEAQIGGKLRGVGQQNLDAGAESFAIRGNAVAELIDDAELDVDVVLPNPAGARLAMMVAGEVVRLQLPARTILGLPADPRADDVRAIIGDEAAERAAGEAGLAPLDGAEPDLFALAEQRFGTAVAEKLVDPLCRSVYSQPAHALRLSVVHPALWAEYLRSGSLTQAVSTLADRAAAGSAVRGIRGGLSALAVALRNAAVRAGAQVSTDTRVLGVSQTPEGFSVRTAETTMHTSQVVLAVGGVTMAELAGLPVTPATEDVVVVTALVRSKELDAHPIGTGVIVAPTVPSLAKALTHSSAKWPWLGEKLGPGLHAIRLSARESSTDFSDVVVVAREISLLTGVKVEADDIQELILTRWTDAVVAADRPSTLRGPGLFATGAAVAGTGLAAVVPHARATAQAVLQARMPSDFSRSLATDEQELPA